MRATELIASLIPQLNEKELETVATAIGRSRITPCERQGHKFKSVCVEEYWFMPRKVKMVCERCGRTIRA